LARQHGLSVIKGHRKVAEEMIERLADFAIAKEIDYLTLWAFSTENWQRSQEEVNGIMDLFRETFSTSAEKLHKKGVRVAVIGNLSRFSKDIQDGVNFWVKETEKNQKLIVVFALNYGGRDEIQRAVNIGGKEFAQFLDTQKMIALPDPDLLIRPGGEKRLSGFLTWQTVYSELYFTDVLMPDFDEREFAKALEDYAQRQRRFGKYFYLNGAPVFGMSELDSFQFFPEPGIEKFLIISIPVKLEIILIMIKDDKAKMIPIIAKVMVFLDFSVAWLLPPIIIMLKAA
jgi:undecaprenyl diphosphate synthase